MHAPDSTPRHRSVSDAAEPGKGKAVPSNDLRVTSQSRGHRWPFKAKVRLPATFVNARAAVAAIPAQKRAAFGSAPKGAEAEF